MEDLTPALGMGAMEEAMGMTLCPLACTHKRVLSNCHFVALAGMCCHAQPCTVYIHHASSLLSDRASPTQLCTVSFSMLYQQ